MAVLRGSHVLRRGQLQRRAEHQAAAGGRHDSLRQPASPRRIRNDGDVRSAHAAIRRYRRARCAATAGSSRGTAQSGATSATAGACRRATGPAPRGATSATASPAGAAAVAHAAAPHAAAADTAAPHAAGRDAAAGPSRRSAGSACPACRAAAGADRAISYGGTPGPIFPSGFAPADSSAS